MTMSSRSPNIYIVVCTMFFPVASVDLSTWQNWNDERGERPLHNGY